MMFEESVFGTAYALDDIVQEDGSGEQSLQEQYCGLFGYDLYMYKDKWGTLRGYEIGLDGHYRRVITCERS